MSHTEMVFKSDLRRWPTRLVPGGVYVLRRQRSAGLQQVRPVYVYRVMRP